MYLSLFEVANPPPHDSDTQDGVVAGNTHTHVHIMIQTILLFNFNIIINIVLHWYKIKV